jgi:hypothetical protein
VMTAQAALADAPQAATAGAAAPALRPQTGSRAAQSDGQDLHQPALAEAPHAPPVQVPGAALLLDQL